MHSSKPFTQSLLGAVARHTSLSALLWFGIGAFADPVMAQEKEAPVVGVTTPQTPDAAPDEEGSISSSIPALAKIKKSFLDKGINVQVNYTGEVLGNPTGGIKQNTIYEGLLDFGFDADLEKLAGIKGGSFHVNAFQIHGDGLTRSAILDLGTISGIEALPSTRLYELFYEQKFLDDKLLIKVGNLAEESDFFISDLGAIYVNGTFGWPAIWDQNLPSTGASYPFATPGIRVKYNPTERLSLLAGIYDGDPTGAGFTQDPELLDRSGTNFRVSDPPLVLAEAQYKYNQEKDSKGLAGTIRLGGWYHFGRFGQTLNPAGVDTVAPFDTQASPYAPYKGNFGLYGIIDQMIYRKPGDDPKKGIGVFLRLSGSPSDRNLVNFYTDAGINFAGLIRNLPEDVLGVAAYYAHISGVATNLDRQAIITTGTPMPVRTEETGLEITYQHQIVPGFVIQPDFQYVFRPGGGIENPLLANGSRIKDAAVFGLRTNIKF